MEKFEKKCKAILKACCTAVCLYILPVAAILMTVSAIMPMSEDAIRSRAVKLIGRTGGACSGVQVMAHGGDYILTAAHCRILAKDGTILAITEDGQTLARKVIMEDDTSDLLLLEGIPNLKGLEVALKDHKTQHVRTFTHGNAFDLYKTEGYLIQDLPISVLVSIIETSQQREACVGSKFKVEQVMTFFGPVTICTLNVIETASTAMTVPGSSGGMIVDDNGKLVGIVSAGDGRFSFFVRLIDIQAFLENY